jgi:hypothetical protein
MIKNYISDKHRLMTSGSGKRRVTITIDAKLLDAINQVSKHRSAVVEALRISSA